LPTFIRYRITTPPVFPGECQIPEFDPFALNPAVTGVFIAKNRKDHRLGVCQEIRQLTDGRYIFEFHDGFHPPIMTGTDPASDSFHIGQDSHSQASRFTGILEQVFSTFLADIPGYNNTVIHNPKNLNWNLLRAPHAESDQNLSQISAHRRGGYAFAKI
jgi:hypothetical protein